MKPWFKQYFILKVKQKRKNTKSENDKKKKLHTEKQKIQTKTKKLKEVIKQICNTVHRHIL